MPQKIHHSEETKTKLIQLRAARATWQEIGMILNIKPQSARHLGGILNARLGAKAVVFEPKRTLKPTDRFPLPPGHPDTWGAISDYPWSCVPR